MWNKIRNSKGFYMLLSILAAVVCWLYVDLANTPNARVTISNIPVTFLNTEYLDAHELLILDEEPTISIVVSGPRSVITRLNRDNVKITASARDITDAGVYSLECTVNLPSAITSSSSNPVNVVSRSATAVDVTVVQMVSKNVRIQPEFTGTVLEGHYYDDNSFYLQQETVEVTGEESAVNSVSYAKVVLSETDLDDTWTGWLDIILCDQNGQELELENLALEATSISVKFFVDSTKDIPLTVTLVPGAGATAEDAKYTIEPVSQITVSGQKVVLDDLSEINLGSIDLSSVVTSDTFEFDVQLPSNVDNRSDVTRVTVQVSVEGLETRRILASNIQLVNAPEGHHYDFNDLEVRVRGKSEDFDLLMNSDIIVTVDLSQVDVVDGTTVTVPAQVEIPGISGLGIIGDYSVPITISAPNELQSEANAGNSPAE